DDRDVAGRAFLRQWLAEIFAQLGVAADPLALDKGLRGGLDLVLALEGLGLLARRQPAVVDEVSVPLQQPPRLQPVWAEMLRHDHAVEDGGLGDIAGRHVRSYNLRTTVRSQA